MRKSIILLIAAVFFVGFVWFSQDWWRTDDRGFVSYELTGRAQYHPPATSVAKQSARNFLVQIMPGDGTMDMTDMNGLSALVSKGMAADRRQFLGYLRNTLNRDWVGVTVEVVSWTLPASRPDSLMGEEHQSLLVITGLTEIPVRIPFK